MTVSSKSIRAGTAALVVALLSGCVSTESLLENPFAAAEPQPAMLTDFSAMPQDASFAAGPGPEALGYAAVDDGGFHLAAIPTDKIDPKYLRQQVPFDAEGQPVGTVIVDTPNRFLYLVEENGMAMRYGISVGGAGFSWAGDATVQMRREWPRWNPPQEMIDRKPELEPYRNGMDAGLQNPLGARALYLFQGGRDTLYRLHGTPEWWTIGNAVSAGCIRLMNQDIIDLYSRVKNGARVVVKQGNERLVGEEEEMLEQPSVASTYQVNTPQQVAQVY